MKKHTDRLRKDKTCLNCGAHVERRYCPECGQENIETRDSFFHLVIEFILDFVHFDSGFWKTTRYLLFSPAKLSLEYLEGKRKSYVNPVKLYIFISFITFFTLAILPDSKNDKEVKQANPTVTFSDDTVSNIEGYGHITSVAQLDSIHQSKPSQERISHLVYMKHKFNLAASKNFRDKRNQEKMLDFLIENLPKTLFVYMPIFAFWMWLFFINRRKYYFDSGIYTLHFFSFVLLLITLFNIFSLVIGDWLGFDGFINDFLLPVGIIYVTYYFFKANRVFYADSKSATRWKSIALFFIHNLFILILLLGYLLIAVTKNYA